MHHLLLHGSRVWTSGRQARAAGALPAERSPAPYTASAYEPCYLCADNLLGLPWIFLLSLLQNSDFCLCLFLAVLKMKPTAWTRAKRARQISLTPSHRESGHCGHCLLSGSHEGTVGGHVVMRVHCQHSGQQDWTYILLLFFWGWGLCLSLI